VFVDLVNFILVIKLYASDGVQLTSSWQCALLAISRYQYFMDFRGFLLQVTTRSTRDKIEVRM
jgi:hypothetical protein